MANKALQINLTNEQLKQLKETGTCEHSRTMGALRVAFVIALDDERIPYVANTRVSSDLQVFVSFPNDRITGGIVPLPEKK